MLRTRIRRLLLGAAILLGLGAYLYWGNCTVGVTRLDVTDHKLPAGFEDFRIAHVSDLHNAEFGADNADLLALLEQERPDIIVMTGDIVDSRHTNMDISAAFAAQAARIAPTYYVTGNHEARMPKVYRAMKAIMEDSGITVLEGEAVTLERNGDTLSLAGLHDQNFTSLQDQLTDLAPRLEGYTILLAHRPEKIGYYAGAGADLVFSGHAHGGQCRIPLLGGIIAPGQGFFPQYTAGLYTVEDTHMVVSRGLGNSSFPVRVNDRPELVIATLKTGA